VSTIKDYPHFWQDGTLQTSLRVCAKHRCEWCGMDFYPNTNLAMFDRTKSGRPVVGTVHHINEIKDDLRWQNLVYLCQTCHMKAQWKWRPGDVIPRHWIFLDKGVPQWIEIRRLPYELDYCYPKPPKLIQLILPWGTR